MRVQVVNEVQEHHDKTRHALCFQYARYFYDDGSMQAGYRFIWRYPPHHNLQPARGQARLPSIKAAQALMDAASSAGWGNHDHTAD